jgi:hypothetical protein
MATFKFGRDIDIHWNGYDIQGPAETVFSIPDQLYEEFNGDIAPVEPTLVWIDTNEFQTLENSVVTSTIVSSAFITTTSLTSGTQISIVSGTATDGYVLTADGAGGVAFEAAPGGAGALSAVIGTSPMSVLTSSGTATVSIDQTSLSVANATTADTLRTYVKNSSGSTISKGQVVYVTGSSGTNALIGLSSASTEAGSSKTLGIAANTMTNNAFGYVIENGQLSNIDTSAATAGSSVWLGNTPGSYVFNSPPAEPSHSVYLGVVTKANVSTGEILVKVQNGYELNELHDVFVGGVSTALPLVYSSTSSGWIAQELTSVGIADNAIVAAKIAAAAVGTSALATAAVVAAKIATSAVTAGHIATGAVTSGHIGTGAVGSAALGTGAVVAAKIATGAVTSGHIGAAAVGTAAISSGAAANGTVLTANGSGGATFQSASIGSVTKTTLTGSGTWVVPTGVTVIRALLLIDGGDGGGRGGLQAQSGTTSVGPSAGGNSGKSGGFRYVENIAVGTATSFTYSVGAGGAGQAAATFSKIATGTGTSSQTQGDGQLNGVGSTFGSFSFPVQYNATAQDGGGGAQNTSAADVTANVSNRSLLLGNNTTIQSTISNATSSNNVIGYWKPSDNYVNGSAGGSTSSTITGGTPTTSTASAGAANTMTSWSPVAGGGGNLSAATTPTAYAGAAGFNGAGGGGGAIRVRLTGTSTVTSLVGGSGGNGSNGIGSGGGAGGSCAVTGTLTDYNASTITTMSSGAGGNGGNGTIVIWY